MTQCRANVAAFALITLILLHLVAGQSGRQRLPAASVLQVLQSSENHSRFHTHLLSSVHPSIIRWLNQSNSFLNFTLLAPSNSAYVRLNRSTSQSTAVWRANKATRRGIARLHVILTRINLNSFDFSASTLQGPAVIPLDEPPVSSLELKGTSKTTRITRSLLAKNGAVHFVDSLLVFPHQLKPVSTVDVFETLQTNYHSEFSHFTKALVNFDLDHRLRNRSATYTIFAVSNLILENEIEKRWNMTLDMLWKFGHGKGGVPIISSILPKHIVVGKYTDAGLLQLARQGRSLTTLNSTFRPRVTITSEGAIRVGDITLVRANVEASNGVIHFVSGVHKVTELNVPNFCPKDARAEEHRPLVPSPPKHEVFKGICVICGPRLTLSCQPHGRLGGPGHEPCCPYQDMHCRGTIRYCRSTECIRDTTPRQYAAPVATRSSGTAQGCCPGYHGEQCQQCPGPLLMPCNGHGQCFDGRRGNGTCRCNPGFSGVACEVQMCTPGVDCDPAAEVPPPQADSTFRRKDHSHMGCPGCPAYCTLTPDQKILCKDHVPDNYFDIPPISSWPCRPGEISAPGGCQSPKPEADRVEVNGHGEKKSDEEKDTHYLIPLGISVVLAIIIIVLVVQLLRVRRQRQQPESTAVQVALSNVGTLSQEWPQQSERVPTINIYNIPEGDSTPSSGDSIGSIPYTQMPSSQQQTSSGIDTNTSTTTTTAASAQSSQKQPVAEDKPSTTKH